MKLKASEIAAYCNMRGGGLEDYENILDVENIVYPMIMAANAKQNQGEKCRD